MSYADIRYEVDDGRARITLDRPERRNAINNQLRAELFEALHASDTDDAVHVTVIRGAGRCFSAGYDLKSDLGADRPYFTAPGGASRTDSGRVRFRRDVRMGL